MRHRAPCLPLSAAVALLVAAALVRAQGAPTILPPQLLAEPVVAYPEDALREGVGGEVVMEVELDAAGAVQWVKVTAAPDARLAWAALGAVSSLAFAPARAVGPDGLERATAVRFSYALSFDLDQHQRDVLEDTAPQRAATGLQGRAVDEPSTPAAAADGDAGVRTEPPHDTDGDLERTALESADTTASADDARVTTVGARRPAESAKQTLTQDVTIIDEAALARVRGRTLADALSDVPGVATVQAGPALAKPVVRGLFGRRLVMLVDGVRHEGQDWGIDHAPEIDPQGAGAIEIVKGAAGVRYGPDAIGGVVLLTPPPLRVTPGADLVLSLFGVDNGLRGGAGGRLDLVLPELPQLALRFEANGTKGAAASAPTYVLGNTAMEVRNLGATASWRTTLAGQGASVTASYRRFQETLGVCYCLKVSTPEALAQAVAADRPVGADAWTETYDLDRPRQDVTHDTALLRGSLGVGGAGRLAASYAFQLDARDEFDQVRRSVHGPQFSFRLFTHAVDASFDHAALRLGSLAVRGHAGVHGEAQAHAYSGLQLIPNYQRVVGGAFLLERLEVTDLAGIGDLEVIGGARADQLLQTTHLSERAFLTQVRRERLELDACARDGDVAHCDKNLHALSLTTGARLRIPAFGRPDAFVVQGDLSSAARFPDVDELYLGGRAPSMPVFGLGDAGLGTERTVQLSLGVEVTTPHLVVDAGAFASRIDDYIAFGPELGADGRPVVDVLITGAYPRFSSRATDAMLHGVDGGLVIAPGALVSVAGQAAIVRGVELDSGNTLPFLPPPQARLELRLNPPDTLPPYPAVPLRGTTLSTAVVLVAQQADADAAADFAPPPAGYVLWNASAFTELALAGTALRVGVEVRNLMDTRHRDALSLTRYFADDVGREVWLRVEARIDDVLRAAAEPPR